MNKKSIVYCAGPQYSSEERNGMLEITLLLEKSGFNTYLSCRDGLEYLIPKLRSNLEVKQSELYDLLHMMNKAVFALETFHVIRRCDSLVLNMNGRVPDEGSVFKASLAFSAGKPVTIYKNDNRSVFNGHDNSMIIGLSGDLPVVKKLNRIPRGLRNAIRKCKKSSGFIYCGDKIPPYVRRVVVFGEEVWSIFNKMDLLKTNKKDVYQQLLRLKNRCEKAEGMRHLQL
jgi:nucleoside 2-deoxyribosyltransferase